MSRATTKSTPTIRQRRRARELADELGLTREPDVRPLPDGDALVIAFAEGAGVEAGDVRAVEVYDALGRPVTEPEAIIGSARTSALNIGEELLGVLVCRVALRVKAGDRVNLRAIAEAAGVSRQTLYTRLRDEHAIEHVR